MWIRGTVVGASTGSTGKLFRSRPTTGGAGDLTPQHVELPIPNGINTTDTLVSWVIYRNRWYGVGMWTDNILSDEHFRVHRLGIVPPAKVPVATASGGPGRSGSCVVAVAFWDQTTDEWSPLSRSSAPVALSNNACVTSNIQATSLDTRVSHVGVWVSMNGASFRLSTKRQLGVTTITESVATLALGAAFFPTFERFPRGSMNEVYHERHLIAGNVLHPDTLYVSALFFPERYEGLSFKTRHGEPIVALVTTRDICLVMTPTGAYGLRGWTESDMELQPIDSDIGAINHQGCRVIHGCAVIPSPKTVFYYNGAFHDILKDRRTEWQTWYKSNRLLFENAVSIHDPNDSSYSFIVRTKGQTIPDMNSYSLSTVPTKNVAPDAGLLVNTVMWTIDYSGIQPELGGGLSQPDSMFDVMNRTVDSAALLGLPGSHRSDVYFGFCDGKSRVKDYADDDDDGDAYSKQWWLRTSAINMGDPGGDAMSGKTLVELWTYLESELKAWTLYAKGGDEDAWRMLTPDNTLTFWRDNVAASYLTESREIESTSYTVVYCAKSLHMHGPQRVTGRCFTLEYRIVSPKNISMRGFGGAWGPGKATRPPTTITASG